MHSNMTINKKNIITAPHVNNLKNIPPIFAKRFQTAVAFLQCVPFGLVKLVLGVRIGSCLCLQ